MSVTNYYNHLFVPITQGKEHASPKELRLDIQNDVINELGKKTLEQLTKLYVDIIHKIDIESIKKQPEFVKLSNAVTNASDEKCMHLFGAIVYKAMQSSYYSASQTAHAASPLTIGSSVEDELELPGKVPKTNSSSIDINNQLIKKFFPLSGKEKTKEIITAELNIKSIGYQEIKIPVQIGNTVRELSAWFKYGFLSQDKKTDTVVLFHANGMVGAQMKEQAEFFANKGFNVLLPTMGGYPGSSGTSTNEISAYQDVEAIKLYLTRIGVENVGYHGLSIGGALAFQAASTESEQTKNLKTMFVIGDQTFTSGPEAAANLIKNTLIRGLADPVRTLAKKALPAGIDVILSGNSITKTDGLNNEAKAADIRQKNIPLLIIQSENDKFMGVGRSKSLKESLPKRLHSVYASDNESDVRQTRPSSPILTIKEKGHCSSFTHDEAVTSRVEFFLRQIETTPSDSESPPLSP